MTMEITALERSFPGFHLGPLSLTVETEVLSVLGPSGCGKTTLLSLIAGFHHPDAGVVTLDDRRVTDQPPENRGIAMVFQAGALFPHLTARENIEYAVDDPKQVTAIAGTLGIRDVLDRPAPTLSGGERQRVALARAVVADPSALVLDEPLANLDAPVRQRLRGDVSDLLADLEIPVIHVTHDQRAAAAIGDRIAVLNDGQLEHVGPPASVFTHPATPFVARFTGGAVLDCTVRREGELILEWGGYPLLAAPPDTRVGDRLQVALRPEELVVGDAPTATATMITGRVHQQVFEGDRHRLTVAVPGAPTSVPVSIPADTHPVPTVGDRITVHIPESALHIIVPSESTASLSTPTKPRHS